MSRTGGRLVPAARRFRAVAVVVVLLACGTAGCSLFDDGTDREVVLIGDSITDMSRDQLDDHLDGWDVEVEAVPGLLIADQQDAIERLVEGSPQAVVVNLGTNDVLDGHPLERSMADLAAMLDVAGQVPCAFVVTINEHIFQLGRDDGWNDAAISLNVELRALAEERGIGVIDWSARVGEELEAGEPNGPVTTDTVHPTEHGIALLVDLYDEALSTC